MNVLAVKLPPLRERKEDIPLLANHFLKKYRDSFGSRVLGISPEAMKTLINYDWPGNVRELENVLERAFVLSTGDMIEPSDVLVDVNSLMGDKSRSAGEMVYKFSYKEARKVAIQDFNREYITRALLATAGNVTKASENSGIERQYFQKQMRKAGIKCSAFREKIA